VRQGSCALTRGGSGAQNGWGLTETSPVLACRRLRERENVRGTVGLPMPGTQVRVVDAETRADLPDGQQARRHTDVSQRHPCILVTVYQLPAGLGPAEQAAAVASAVWQGRCALWHPICMQRCVLTSRPMSQRCLSYVTPRDACRLGMQRSGCKHAPTRCNHCKIKRPAKLCDKARRGREEAFPVPFNAASDAPCNAAGRAAGARARRNEGLLRGRRGDRRRVLGRRVVRHWRPGLAGAQCGP